MMIDNKSPSFLSAPSSVAVKSPRRKLYLAIAAQLVMMASPSFAGPEGGVIVGGSGSIDKSGVNTTINQNTDRLSIDWQSFDVGADERVQFIQPDQDSVALNRILGGNGSSILGKIDANGHVILMNANGVFFGENATVNVGGLVATGLSVEPSDFMNGAFVLEAIEGSEGAVVNAGVINAATGGNVALIGQTVENQGYISAKLGSVTLAAGKAAVVSFDNQGLLGVRVTEEILQEEIGLDAAVQNSGDIQAEGGRILLTGSVSQDIFTQAVNAGDLNAKTSVVVHDDGSFTLGGGADVVNTGTLDVSGETSGRIVVVGENVSNSGAILANGLGANDVAGSVELHAVDITKLSDDSTISASSNQSGRGGDVKVLGDKVALLDDAKILATGANGGGSILVGGDQEGKNNNVRNADFIYIDEETNIDASATENGDGGTVISFAKDTARIYGDLAARGGVESGDGGFIETSGLKGFEITKAPDTSTENGNAGSWLIDPYDIVITDGDVGYDRVDNIFTSNSDSFNDTGVSALWTTVLEDALKDGTTVTVKTGDGGTQSGDIWIDRGIQLLEDVTSTLILDAHNDIIVNSSISPNDTLAPNGILNLDFRAGGDLSLNGDNSVALTTGGGAISIEAAQISMGLGSSVDTGGGDFIVTESSDFSGEALIDTGGGNVDINMSGMFYPSNIVTQGGSISISAAGGAGVQGGTYDTTGGSGLGNIIIQSDGMIIMPSLEAGGSVQISTTEGDIRLPMPQGTADIAGDLLLSAPNGNIVYPPITSGDINIQAGGNLTLIAADVIISEGTVSTHLQAGNNLTIETGTTFQILSDLSAGGDMNITSTGGGITLLDSSDGSLNPSGALTLDAVEDIILNTNIVLNNADFKATSGNDFVSELLISTGGGDFSLSTTAGNVGINGDLNTGGGEINLYAGLNGSVDIAAEANVNSGGGNVSLQAENDITLNGTVLTSGGTASINPGRDLLGSTGVLDTRTGGASEGDVSIGAQASSLPQLIVGGNLDVYSLSINLPSSGIDVAGDAILTSQFNMGYESSSDVELIAGGDIVLTSEQSDVDLVSGSTGSLTIDAGDQLTIKAQGSIDFTAGVMTVLREASLTAVTGDILVQYTSLETGVLTLNAAENITLNADLENDGLIVTSGNDFIGDGAMRIRGGGFTADVGGDFTLNSLSGASQEYLVSTLGGDVTIHSGGVITLWDQITTSGGVFSAESGVDESANGFVLVGTVDTGGGSFTSQSEGRFIIANNTNLLTDGGSIDIRADGMVGQTIGGIDFDSPFNPVFDTSTDSSTDLGDITIVATGFGVTLPKLVASGDLITESFDDIDSNFGAVISGDVILNAGTDIISNSDFTLNGGSFSAIAGNGVDIDGSISTGGGNISLQAAENVALGAINTGGGNFEVISPDSHFSSQGIKTSGGDILIDVSTIGFNGLEDDRGSYIFDASGSSLNGSGNISISATGEVASPEIITDTSSVGNVTLVSKNSGIVASDISGANNVSLEARSLTVETSKIEANNLNVLMGWGISQAGAWVIANNTHLEDVNSTGVIDLTHPENQLNTLTSSSTFDISIQLSEIDGITLGDIGSVKSLAINTPSIIFDGKIQGLSADELALIQINGTDSQDSITITSAAEFENIDPASFINLGLGDDTANISASVPFSIFGGAGDDIFNILVDDITLAGLDGGIGSDTLDLGSLDVRENYLRETTAGNVSYNATSFETTLSDSESTSVLYGVDGYDATWTSGENGAVSVLVLDDDGTEVSNFDFTGKTELVGADGEDAFIFDSTLHTVDTVSGGGGRNTLTGSDSTNTWLVDGVDQGTLINGNASTRFNNIAHLIGGNAEDLFDITTGGSITGTIAGGLGVDLLLMSDPTATNAWNFTAQNTVDAVAEFSEVESVQGNGNLDTFNFNGVTDVVNIDGAIGGGVVNWTGSDLTVDLEAQNLNSSITYASVNTFNGDAAQNNILIGTNSDTNWALTAYGEGSVIAAETNTFSGFNNLVGGSAVDTVDGYDTGVDLIWNVTSDGAGTLDSSSGSIAFSDMEALFGSNSDDTFNLQGQIDNVGGGGGINTLASSDQDNMWTVSTINGGLLNTTSFSNIQNIVGGGGVDTVNMSAGLSIGDIQTGAGDDIVNIGANASVQNILTGVGSDTVTLGDLVTISSLDGGADVDTLDITAFTAAIEKNFLNGTTSSGLQSQNFETELFNPDGSSLFGGDLKTDWIILDDNNIEVTAYNADGSVFKTEVVSAYSLLRGGSGENAFTLAGGQNFDGTIQGDETGENTLTGNDSNFSNFWIIDGQNSGTLEGSDVVTVFSNIANLIGGSGNDVFEVVEGGFVGSVSGGAAGGTPDGLNVNLLGGDQIWTVNSENSGTFLANGEQFDFTNIEALGGGDVNDIFNIGANIRVINGGAGVNSLTTSLGIDHVISITDSELDSITGQGDIAKLVPDGTGIGLHFDNIQIFNVVGAGISTVFEIESSTFTTISADETVDATVSFAGAVGAISIDLNSNTFTNIDIYEGNGTDSELIALDTNNQWQMTGDGSGTLNTDIAFTNFTSIRGGTATDTLAASDQANTWEVTGVNSGTLNSNLTFDGVEVLSGGNAIDTFNFSALSGVEQVLGQDGSDVFTVADNVTITLIDGGAGSDTLNLGGVEIIQDFAGNVTAGETDINALNIEETTSTGGITYFGGDGNNTWLINGDGTGTLTKLDGADAGDYDFIGVTSLLGGADTDDFVLQEGGSLQNGISGGGSIGNSLTAQNNSDNAWLISGADQGTLTTDSSDLVFDSIANLIGADNADIFEVATGGSISGTIQGGLGLDGLVNNDSSSYSWSFGDGSDFDSLITGEDSVVRFSQVESVTGGSGLDSFHFYNGTTDVVNIDGGLLLDNESNSILGEDGTALIVNLENGTLNYYLDDESLSDNINISNVNIFRTEQLFDADNNPLESQFIAENKANAWSFFSGQVYTSGTLGSSEGALQFFGFTSHQGGTGIDTLTGIDVPEEVTWTVDADNSGSVTQGDNLFNFTGFENLVGSASDDTFNISAQIDSIDGGAGTNTLTAGNQANAWDVTDNNVGTLNTTSFASIQNLIGGGGIDSVNIATGLSIGDIQTGAGNDIVNIGAGVSVQNILTGAGSDTVTLGDLVVLNGTLDGGADEDTLDITAFTAAIEKNFLDGTSSSGLQSQNFEAELFNPEGSSLFGGDLKTDWVLLDDNNIEVTAYNADGSVFKTEVVSAYTLLRGGSGENAFTLASGQNFDGSIQGDEAGENTLTGSDLVNTWVINGQNSGSIQEDGSDVTTVFSNIANLIGGSESDSFEVEVGGSLAGSVVAGLGVGDSLRSNDVNVNEWRLAQETGIDGLESNGGLVVAFSGIESIIGGAEQDTISFSGGLTDVINIEGSTDFIDGLIGRVSLEDSTLNYHFTDGTLSDVINFTGVHTFRTTSTADSLFIARDTANDWTLYDIGESELTGGQVVSGDSLVSFHGFSSHQGGTGIDTLTGVNDGDSVTWTVDADNSGSVTQGDNFFNFTGFESLVGSASDDTFNISAQIGSIDGGAGINTLIAGNQANAWDVTDNNVGTLNTTSFANIQNLIGGDGIDTVNIATGLSIGDIQTGAGDDIVNIGANASVENILTGAGSDSVTLGDLVSINSTLDGGADEDTLDITAFTAAIEKNFLDGTSSSGLQSEGFETELFNPEGSSLFGGDLKTDWVFLDDNNIEVTAYNVDGTVFKTEVVSAYTLLRGGSGENEFTLAGGQNFDGSIQGDEAGENTLTGSDLVNTWIINGQNSGTIQEDGSDVTTVFSNIANLIGGSESDAFELLADGSISGFIQGGLGLNDSLFANNNEVGHNWKLAQTNEFDLLTQGEASSLLFNGIENIVGSSGVDTFEIYSGITDVINIDGGIGQDPVNVVATFEHASIVNLDTREITHRQDDGVVRSPINFSRIDGFSSGSANGENSPSTNGLLIGANSVNEWTINRFESSDETNSTVSGSVISNGEETFIYGNFDYQGGSDVDTLVGYESAEEQIWNVTSDNSGTVSIFDTTERTEIVFSGFENLVGSASNDTFNISAQINSIHGGAGINTLTAGNQANTWDVTDNNLGTLNTTSFANIQNLIGGDGIDSVNISTGLSIGDIQTGAGDDIVNIGAGVSVENILTGAGSDSVNLGDLVVINGTLDGGADEDTLDITAFTAAIEKNFLDGTSSSGLQSQNFETELFNPEGSSLFGGDLKTDWVFLDDNNIEITAYNVDGSVFKTEVVSAYTLLRGGSGENAFALASGQNFDGAIQGDEAGDNTLTGSDLVNTWIINGQNSGTIQDDGGSVTTVFSNIANLIGGSESDLFEVAEGGVISGSIQGGLGVDTLLLSNPTATNTWTFAAQNTVDSISQFSGIESAQGNANLDTFNFNGVTDVVNIDGATGGGIVNWTGSNLNVDLEGQNLNVTITYANVNGFNADVTQNNTLIGTNADSTWNLTSNNEGSVVATETNIFSGFNSLEAGTGTDILNGYDTGVDLTWDVTSDSAGILDSTDGSIAFSGIESLVGSSSDDAFNISAQMDSIDGGAGTNTLTAGNQANAWDVTENNAGTLNTTSFANIQNLIGGDGIDTINIATGLSIGDIQTGAGDDIVNIGASTSVQNILTGAGSDSVTLGDLVSISNTLDGGAGDDRLDMSAFSAALEKNFLDGTTSVGLQSQNFETEILSDLASLYGGDLKTDWIFLDDNSIEVTAYNADGSVFKTEVVSSYTSIRGGSGENLFQLASDQNFNGRIQGDVNGDNSLTGSDLINNWIIDGQNSGSLQEEGGSVTTVFSNIASIIGSRNTVDTFSIIDGGMIAQIDAGAPGSLGDRLILDQSIAATWSIGAGSDQVVISETDIIGFSGINSITGSLGDDIFNVTGTQTTVTGIDARTGVDTLSISGIGEPLIVDLQNARAGWMAVAGIGSFSAEVGLDNQLIGLNAEATWAIDGNDSGVVDYQDQTVSFNGFDNIQGGSAVDQFTLTSGQISGVINGGLGEDTLTAANVDNTWVLGELGGTLNGNGFESIESLIGNAGQDDFTLASATTSVQTIDAGLGENSLKGFDQDNTWQVSNDGTGLINSQLSFAGVQSFIGGDARDTFNIEANTTLKDIYSGEGDDTFNVGANSTVDNLYGEAGDDQFTIGDGLVVNELIDGGTSTEVNGDVIDFSQYNVVDASFDIQELVGFTFSNFEDVTAPKNEGTYFGGNGTNIWYITGEDEGRLEIVDGSDAGVYTFSGIDSVRGGTGDDTFIFEGDQAAVTTIIDGGTGGNNTLDLSGQNLVNQWILSGETDSRVTNSANEAGNVFTNIASIIGGSNLDTLRSDNAGQTSTWLVAGVDQGSLDTGANFTNFFGIERLEGGQGQDNFTIAASGFISNGISGGLGTALDSLTHEGDANQWLLAVTADASGADQVGGTLLSGQDQASLVFVDFEHIHGGGANDSLLGGDQNNTWSLGDNLNNSFVNLNNASNLTISFDGMESITGGSADDIFNIANAASVPSAIDGGLGNDTVNLQNVAADVDILLGDNTSASTAGTRLQLVNINTLQANANQNHALLGASDQGYTWIIDGQASGTVSSSVSDAKSQSLSFSNISTVVGGAHDDIFQVSVNTTISLDGGDAVTADFVDYSQVNANLSINLAQALNGNSGVVTGIEGIRGNNSGVGSINTSELVGSDTGNTWTITDFDDEGIADGINDGQVVDGNTVISFMDFNVLTGGSGADTFEQVGGVIEGTINGGAGNDVLNVTIAESSIANSSTEFIGGADNDTLNMIGGSAGMSVAYTESTLGGEFVYSDSSAEYSISHQGAEFINEGTLGQTLELKGSTGADSLAIGNDHFSFNQNVEVQHTNKDNLIVSVSNNDTVEITENILLPGSFTLLNGSLVSNDPSNTSISATQLVLDSTQNVGSSSSRIRTNIDDLALRNVVGDVYLQEQNGLNISELVTTGVFDLLLLNGNLTSTTVLNSVNDFRVVAENGDIVLQDQNQLLGSVDLTSSGEVALTNAQTINIAGISAETLILRSMRAIEQEGSIIVSGDTTLEATSNISLDNPLNNFNRLAIIDALDVSIVDQDAISLMGINARGQVTINGVGISVEEVMSADSIVLNGSTGSVNVNADLHATGGDVDIHANQIIQNADIISASSARLISDTSIQQGGSIKAGADVETTAEDGDISVSEGSVTQGAVVSISASKGLQLQDVNAEAINISGGELVVNGGTLVATDGDINVKSGSFNMNVNSVLDAKDGSIKIIASDGEVVMDETTSIVADAGGVDIAAEDDIVVGSIDSSETVVLTTDKGAIVDGNGEKSNIDAEVLVVDANSGIGESDALETKVSEVDAVTEVGDVKFDNTGPVDVTQIKTEKGDVALNNDGDVNLAAQSVTAIGAAGGSVVTITSDGGNIIQTGSKSESAINTETVILNVPDGAVGEGSLNLNGVENLIVTAQYVAGDIHTSPGATRDIQFSGTFTFEDQLLVVESSDDISPAVFSNVKGYFFNDISVKLPLDQLYDEDEEYDDE